jgi:hypothetical protein
MPRWFRLVPALLVYTFVMAGVVRSMHRWALPPEERTFESVTSMLLTLLAFAVIGAMVVYRLFVRPGSRRQDAR